MVGPIRQTFQTPVRVSLMSSEASMCLLDALHLVIMEDMPPKPLEFCTSDTSSSVLKAFSPFTFFLWHKGHRRRHKEVSSESND